MLGIAIKLTQWLGGSGVEISPPAAGTGEPIGLLLVITKD